MSESLHKSVPQNSQSQKLLECSTEGDKRFCASCAMVKIHGVEKSIESWYSDAKRNSLGNILKEGEVLDHIVDPFTGDRLPAKEGVYLYRGLWITYLNNHPELVEYASQFDDFTNCFSGKGLENCHEEIIGAYIKGNRDFYVAGVRASRWYQNMAERNKASLREQIQKAKAGSVRGNVNGSQAEKKVVQER